MKQQKTDYLHLVSKHITSYFSGKSRSLEIDGQEWKYLDLGEGEVVVFLHGFCCNKSFWRSQMQSYGRDYRCIALDIPGASVTQYLNQRSHSLSELCRWLDKVLEKLQLKRIHLVAHSAMTWFATLYASTRRQQVQSLTLINMPDFLGSDSNDESSAFGIFERSIKIADVETMEQNFQTMFFNPPSIPRIIYKYHLNEWERHREDFMQIFRDYQRSIPMVLAHTKHISCPTLIINGDHDVYSSNPFLDSLRWHFPMAQIVKLQNCGHFAMVEKTHEVAALHHAFLQNQRQPEPGILVGEHA